MNEWLKIETNVGSCVEDCRSVSNSAAFECILQPGDTQNKKSSKRDSNEHTASNSQMRHSDVNSNSSAGTLAAETTNNPIGTRLSHHNTTIFLNNVGHLEKV